MTNRYVNPEKWEAISLGHLWPPWAHPNLAESFKRFAQLYFIFDARLTFDTAVDVEVVGC